MKRLIILLFFTQVGVSCWGQKSLKTLTSKVDQLVAAKMKDYNIPGLAIGIVQNGKVIYAKGYGVKNIKTKERVAANTIFHLASVSKLLTAEAIMQLVEKGALRLEDRLVEILPQLSFDDGQLKQITLKQMLNHTAGLPDVYNYHWGNKNQTNDALKNDVLGKKFRLKQSPGSKYFYSNLAYDVLGYIVQKASGQVFEDYIKSHILDKANMANSDFRYFKIPEVLRCSPHSRNRLTKRIFVRKTYPYNRVHAPSSTLNSSAKEMCQWMIYFLKKLKTNKTYQSMLKSSFAAYPHIGLGFQLGTINNIQRVGHFGGDKGFRSYLMMIPEKDMGLVIMGNCDYKDDFRHEILHPIARVMLKE